MTTRICTPSQEFALWVARQPTRASGTPPPPPGRTSTVKTLWVHSVPGTIGLPSRSISDPPRLVEPAMTFTERELEDHLVAKRLDLKCLHRSDVRDRAALEGNFRQKFNARNHVRLTDAECPRLLEEITSPDVFTAAQIRQCLR